MTTSETLPAVALPNPTRDLDQAERDLEEAGVCLVSGLLEPSVLARARESLYYEADQDRRRGMVERFVSDRPDDHTNQRVWNLLSRDPVFCDLAQNEAALRFVRKYIGWPALLSQFAANITGPGGGEMILHTDQNLFPQPWPEQLQTVNAIWCLDDFTEENGATQVVPGSHHLRRAPTGEDQAVATVPLTAEAGTMIVLGGRTWHRTGFNRTESGHRAGILAVYVQPMYRTQENWFLSLSPMVKQYGSDTLLQLLGYRTDHNLGRVNGAVPT